MFSTLAAYAFILFSTTMVVDSAHIFIFDVFTSKSETILFYPFAEALAQRGHEVTVISPYPSKKPLKGVNLINPEELIKNAAAEAAGDTLMELKFHGATDEWYLMSMIKSYVEDLTDMVMIKDKEVKKLVDSGKKVDLMIINGCMNDMALPLVHIFKCPFMYLDGPGVYPWHMASTGTPLATSYAPSINSEFGDRMDIWERATNTLRVLAWHFLREYMIIPNLENKMMPMYIKEDTPPLIDIDRNVSIVLSCRDSSLEYPRSFPPNVIRIGCLHCQEPKPLPKDLTDFIDGSGEAGFIYFSFGSVVKLNKNVDFIKRTFFKAFSQLPQRVLVKWDKPVTNEEVGAPPNVKLAQWLPQQDILGHPKIKAFISHGGLFSTMDTVFHGVPVLSFPFFFDQNYNAGLEDRFGFGIKMDLVTVTASQILDALRRLTEDPSFQRNVKHRSRLFRDKPKPPMETAVYWTEFVLRHKGAAHLRPASVDLPAYQLDLVDVILVFGGTVLLIVLLFFLILRSFFRMILSVAFSTKTKKE